MAHIVNGFASRMFLGGGFKYFFYVHPENWGNDGTK